MTNTPTSVPSERLNAATHNRAQRIAAIHAFADFLALHPEYPVPKSLVASHKLTADDEIDEQTRATAVARWGYANEARMSEDEYDIAAWVTVIDSQAQGIRISYCYSAQLDPKASYVKRFTA